jgi:hypothetical protein
MECRLHISLVLVTFMVLPSHLSAAKDISGNYGGIERPRHKTNLLHPPSPCPSVFSYEGREAEKDRWFGVILVTTEELLTGLRLDLMVDRPASLLGVSRSLWYYEQHYLMTKSTIYLEGHSARASWILAHPLHSHARTHTDLMNIGLYENVYMQPG